MLIWYTCDRTTNWAKFFVHARTTTRYALVVRALNLIICQNPKMRQLQKRLTDEGNVCTSSHERKACWDGSTKCVRSRIPLPCSYTLQLVSRSVLEYGVSDGLPTVRRDLLTSKSCITYTKSMERISIWYYCFAALLEIWHQSRRILQLAHHVQCWLRAMSGLLRSL